ncbi:MAG: hypothetical protein ACJ77B_06680 [Chloroflexota bacterium]
MNHKVGIWTRRALMATLPFGTVLAGYVVVRVVLLVSGSEPARAIDVVGLFIQALMAVALMWSGRENRRTLSARDTTPR